MSTDVQINSNQPDREKERQDAAPDDSLKTVRKSPSKSRKMVRSELMGDHTHETSVGVNVHIYERDGKYLARGRLFRKQTEG